MQEPKDIHGRLIKAGDWLIADTSMNYYYRVTSLIEKYDPDRSDTGTGFRMLAMKPGESSLNRPNGMAAGNHVKWEVVARGGDTAPTLLVIPRDDLGQPIITHDALPIDRHGRDIDVGNWLRSENNAIVQVTKVYPPRPHSNHAGFDVVGSQVGHFSAGAHVAWEVIALDGEVPPENILRDQSGKPILGKHKAPKPAAPRITLEKVLSTSGQALDDLARELGTLRIGEDSDEELREQLGRALYKLGPEQAIEFLEALTKSCRREYYPDVDRDLKAKGKCFVRHLNKLVIYSLD